MTRAETGTVPEVRTAPEPVTLVRNAGAPVTLAHAKDEVAVRYPESFVHADTAVGLPVTLAQVCAGTLVR
jgi:hypothetical protein